MKKKKLERFHAGGIVPGPPAAEARVRISDTDVVVDPTPIGMHLEGLVMTGENRYACKHVKAGVKPSGTFVGLTGGTLDGTVVRGTAIALDICADCELEGQKTWKGGAS